MRYRTKIALLPHLLSFIFVWMGCNVYRNHKGQLENFPAKEDTSKPIKSESKLIVAPNEHYSFKSPFESSEEIKTRAIFRDSLYKLFNKITTKVDQNGSRIDQVILSIDTGLSRQKTYISKQDSLISLVVSYHFENSKLKADTIRLSKNAKISTDQKVDAQMFNMQRNFGSYLITILLACIFTICLCIAILYRVAKKSISYV